MKYLGWKKRVENPSEFDEEKIIDIYVFDNPELVEYDNGITALRALGQNVVFYEISTYGSLEQLSTGAGVGKGFKKENFCKVNKNTESLAERIGIERKQLEFILSNF